MAKKVIRCTLSADSIGNAIKELEQYKRDVARKTEFLRQKAAERVENLVQSGFNGAVVDDLLNGGARHADVQVSVSDRGNVSVVIAKGEDTVWVEFGAGVFHNGSAGNSPHPDGSELGFTIGGYGKGMGKRRVWGFREGGELHLTHGTPATMPMYNAIKIVSDEIADIAREVFG